MWKSVCLFTCPDKHHHVGAREQKYYRSLRNILEFLNFLWGEKGSETIKCFKEMKSSETHFLLFPFLLLFSLCSVQFHSSQPAVAPASQDLN